MIEYTPIQREVDRLALKDMQEKAEVLGLTLQEYMLFAVLRKLDDLQVTTYSGD